MTKVKDPAFNYVAYDDVANATSGELRDLIEQAKARINKIEHANDAYDASTGPARYRVKAVDALEEAFMWIGKLIREDQIARQGAQNG